MLSDSETIAAAVGVAQGSPLTSTIPAPAALGPDAGIAGLGLGTWRSKEAPVKAPDGACMNFCCGPLASRSTAGAARIRICAEAISTTLPTRPPPTRCWPPSTSSTPTAARAAFPPGRTSSPFSKRRSSCGGEPGRAGRCRSRPSTGPAWPTRISLRGALYKTVHDARKKLRSQLAERGLAVGAELAAEGDDHE